MDRRPPESGPYIYAPDKVHRLSRPVLVLRRRFPESALRLVIPVSAGRGRGADAQIASPLALAGLIAAKVRPVAWRTNCEDLFVDRDGAVGDRLTRGEHRALEIS